MKNMGESPHRPELPDIPEAVAAPKSARSMQLVWLIPIVAVLVGGWLAVKTILERGPTITISFKTGESLEEGKTKIKYKDIQIGLVTSIALSQDRKQVVATAQLDKDAEGFLVEDTRFWVARPRVTAAGVTGLSTLLSGAYIVVEPGREQRKRREFVALEEAPIVTREDPGREFVLRAADLSSIDIGSPVYFRRFNVGEVVSRDLDKDGKGVSIGVFIHAPHDQYVTTNTRFWNASGIDVSLGAEGFRVQTESLAAILVGGIAFQARPDADVAPAADAKTVFHLFPTRDEAMKRPDLQVVHVQFVFKDSVRGLSEGAPVEFRGVTIGEVIRIRTEFEPGTFTFVQPVEAYLYPDRLRARSRDKGATLPPPETPEMVAKRAQLFVEQGMRGQLQTGNLLTGQKFVAVEFFPNAPKVKLDTSKRPFEIPTMPGGFEELEGTVKSILKKLDKVQYEEISADVRKVIETLDQTLKDSDVLVKRLGAETTPELNRTLEEARRALKSAEGALASESPLQTDLREALRELARAAQAFRTLADYLERHPEALIQGKKEEVK